MFNYHDQADGLRRIMATSSARIVSVMGVDAQPTDTWLGNLAASMVAPEQRTLLIQANKRSMTTPSLQAVAQRESILSRAIVRHPQGYDLASLAETDALTSPLSGDLKAQLDGIVKQLAYDYDTVMIEARLDPRDYTFMLPMLAQHALVIQVARNEEAIKLAYAAIKRICQQHGQLPLSVMVTDASYEQGQQYFMRLNQVCQQFLGLSLGFLGTLPDTRMAQEIEVTQNNGSKHRHARESSLATQSALAFKTIARNLEKQRLTTPSLAAA